MLDTTKIDFADSRFKADPYPLYAQLRAEAPVCRVKLWGLDGWMVTRYDDVVAAFKDERLASDRRRAPTQGRPLREEAMFRLTGALNRTMLASDEPDHTRLRALVQKAFTQRRVEGMRQRVQERTEEFLDAVATQKRMDVIHDLALPLPTTIIAEMLGLPVSDRERFHRWTDAILTLSSMSWQNIAKAGPTMFALRRYIKQMVRLRRKQPGDDLISALVTAEEAGDKLNEDEMAAMIFLLLFAGHETTVNLIGNGTLALLENLEAMEELRKNPSIMPLAVEELLRYDGPLELTNVRWARCDFRMNGATIGKGEPVLLCLTAANRDETQFANPDRLNIRREPNRHVAFGQGIHYCLGAFLARLEAQTAFNALLRNFPDMRLAVPREELRWRRSFALRGLESLPVEWN